MATKRKQRKPVADIPARRGLPDKDYTVVRLTVLRPGEEHVRCFSTNFDVPRADRQKLLEMIAAHLASEIGNEMWPTYRPSPIEELDRAMRERRAR